MEIILWMMLMSASPDTIQVAQQPAAATAAAESATSLTERTRTAIVYDYLASRGIVDKTPGRTIVIERGERPYSIYDGTTRGTRYSFRGENQNTRAFGRNFYRRGWKR